MDINAHCIAPHAIAAYILRLTEQGVRYLLIRRCGSFLCGTWQMVTGGIEPGETASEAALREIYEETGLIPTAFFSADTIETFYSKERDKVVFMPVFVAFTDKETVALSPKEHDAYEWLSFEEAKQRLIWQEQKRILEHVHSVFVLQEPSAMLCIPVLTERNTL